MFELARLKDTVHIAPSEFGKPPLTAVTDALLEKYPNKVVPGLGLCIALFDILHVGEAHLYPGNAAQHTAVEFRLVIFKPYVGEILTGTVVASDPQGMRISLGFFDEIHVPARLLQPPSVWSEEEGVWVWNVTPENEDEHRLFYDLENELRFRVEEVRFREERNVAASVVAAKKGGGGGGAAANGGAVAATRTPSKGGGAAAAAAAAGASGGTPGSGGNGNGESPNKGGGGGDGGTEPTPVLPPAPAMLIVAGVDRSGLGLTSWWPPDDVDEEGGS